MTTKDSTIEEKMEWLSVLQKKSDTFNLALGRFVSIFSMVETNLQTYVWGFAGVPAPTAQAIFSGIRVKGAMQLINRISDAQKWKQERKNELAYTFLQLGMINNLRNDVLHYGADDVAPNFYPAAIGVWRSVLSSWAGVAAVRGAEPSVERSAADRRCAA